MKLLSNMPKDTKQRVLAAIEKSGQREIEWHDEPSDAMPLSMRADYGAVYGGPGYQGDASKFWKAYRDLDTADTKSA
jgi:hypothetical protein